MAKTHVIYLNEMDEDLCFKCAVTHVAGNDCNAEIRMETTDYGYSKCSKCGEYINDKIEIYIQIT